MKTRFVMILLLVSGCGPQVVDLRVKSISELDGIVFFEDTWFTGVVEEYHGFERDAQIKSSSVYKDGVKDGLYEEWFEDGQMAALIKYFDGKPNGSWEQWYPNGQTSVRAQYEDGVRNGLYEEWFEDGQMAALINYFDGKPNGSWEQWYPNGQTSIRALYEDGVKDGLYEEWFEDGRINERSVYEHGRLTLNHPQAVLGQSIEISIVAVNKALTPVRVTIDDDFRRPYWIEKDSSRGFTIKQSFSLDRFQGSEIWIEGNRIPQSWLSASSSITIDRFRIDKWLRENQ